MFSDESASQDETGRPDLDQARRTALMAHSVVIKLQELGLPDDLGDDLAALSTDLGDLWGAQKAFDDCLDGMLNSSADWEAVAERLVDLSTVIEHIGWHAKSVREPIGRIAEYAYRNTGARDGDEQ